MVRVSQKKKVYGQERRELILTWLQESQEPLAGTEIAERTNVSRQVIVQDVSLLKAGGKPIIATSRGYVLFSQSKDTGKIERVIAVNHTPEETATELYMLVDHGIHVKNVMVEHPLYGDLTGSLMLRHRRDVDDFISELAETHATLLSRLTDGVHLHTLEADSQKELDQACDALRRSGILLKQ